MKKWKVIIKRYFEDYETSKIEIFCKNKKDARETLLKEFNFIKREEKIDELVFFEDYILDQKEDSCMLKIFDDSCGPIPYETKFIIEIIKNK